MEEFYKLPVEERHKLNKQYRDGVITRQDLKHRMKSGLFDHDRLLVKEKFKQAISQIESD